MRKPFSTRRILTRFAWIGGLLAFALSVFFVYRWAESPADRLGLPLQPAMKRVVAVRLENAPFTAFADNRKTWSLRAARIDLERFPGATISHIESATLTDIRRGILYQLPDALPLSPAPAAKKAPPAASENAAATFHAQRGHYTLGEIEAVAPDIALVFRVKWQFRLEGDVVFRTASGDELRAPSLTILEMTSKRNAKLERRIVCESGATLQGRGIRIQSNLLRYNPADRTVECLNGVRGTFRDGFVQADRAYWSPAHQTLSCPAEVSGELQEMPFQATDVKIDVRRRKLYANTATLKIRIDALER